MVQENASPRCDLPAEYVKCGATSLRLRCSCASGTADTLLAVSFHNGQQNVLEAGQVIFPNEHRKLAPVKNVGQGQVVPV
eukprot:CAMPEP_0177661166 /NCGR_PEP_ID=MMETSP0447-20121125/18504_1 /TAXON_ID=0 /ORGANISM="Stygamoeba regulata, Strain BSH-02190019" /LENGTH=79 /DNA_ID=CAMNT_0019166431 /DNA_START=675 /DNA_END=910 /DNA_ORIENTATION=-